MYLSSVSLQRTACLMSSFQIGSDNWQLRSDVRGKASSVALLDFLLGDGGHFSYYFVVV
jgi:hypothetical protein